MTVKGMAIPAYDPRGIKGMGIAYATITVAPAPARLPPAAEVIANVLGPATLTTRWSGRARGNSRDLPKRPHHDDCLDVCKFATFAESLDVFAASTQLSRACRLTPAFCSRLGSASTIWNATIQPGRVCRRFRLPARALSERAFHRPGSKGHICELPEMLEEYYQERGWVNGVVTKEKLKELELI